MRCAFSYDQQASVTRPGVCDACGGELYQRTDDNEETIKARMQVYETSTQPIIDYYAKQDKLKKLDGNLENR